MDLTVSVVVNASRQEVWDVITDIEHAADRISAIESVEVLERPETGMLGFKWKETRRMMGKTATETMWITRAVEYEFYETRAESHGAVYTSRISLEEHGESTRLSMRFHGQPVKMSAKIFTACLGFLFVGGMRQALNRELEDIKAAVEGETGRGATSAGPGP